MTVTDFLAMPEGLTRSEQENLCWELRMAELAQEATAEAQTKQQAAQSSQSVSKDRKARRRRRHFRR